MEKIRVSLKMSRVTGTLHKDTHTHIYIYTYIHIFDHISPILFNLYSECLTKEALDELGDFNIGGQIIQTVKYAYDLVLMAKEETVLQGMIDKIF